MSWFCEQQLTGKEQMQQDSKLALFLCCVSHRYELCIDVKRERRRDHLSPHERSRPDRPGAAAVFRGAVEPAGERQPGGGHGPAGQHGVHHVWRLIFYSGSKMS